jgi:hypothetical protein
MLTAFPWFYLEPQWKCQENTKTKSTILAFQFNIEESPYHWTLYSKVSQTFGACADFPDVATFPCAIFSPNMKKTILKLAKKQFVLLTDLR